MNLSGESVRALIDYYKIDLNDILVAHDEVDLPFAHMKLQKDRGHGGNNGIRSIHEHLGTKDYARLKLGVDKPTRGDVAAHVLQNFSQQEMSEMNDFISNALDASLACLLDGFDKAANQFNSKKT